MRIKQILIVLSIVIFCSVVSYRLGVLAQMTGALKSIVEPGSMVTEASYVIFTDGNGNYYARNGDTGEIQYKSTNASWVIQSAINSVPSWGTVFLKKGVYNSPSVEYLEIDDSNPVYLTGELGTTLERIGIRINSDGNDYAAFRPVLSNLIIDGMDYTKGSVGLWIKRFHHTSFKDIFIKRWDVGIKLVGGLWIIDFYNTRVYDSSSYGIYIAGLGASGADEAVNAINFYGGWIGSCDICVYAQGETRDVHFFGTDLEPAGTNIVKLEEYNGYIPRAWVFDGCTFEAYVEGMDVLLLTGTGPNYYYGPRHITFRDCAFNFGNNVTIINVTHGWGIEMINPDLLSFPNATYSIVFGAESNECEVNEPRKVHIYPSLSIKNSGTNNRFIGHNILLRTENSGTTIITNGDWIIHGLTTTPSIVTLTPRSNVNVWVNDRNATHFQVGVSSGTVTVDWYAEV